MLSSSRLVRRTASCEQHRLQPRQQRTFACSTPALDEDNSGASTTGGVYRPAPMQPFPQSPRKTVPNHIPLPPYARTGVVPLLEHPEHIYIHHTESAERMRQAARLARQTLDLACAVAKPGVSTDHVDAQCHQAIIAAGAYPSPLNYAGFPKSVW